MCEMFPGSALTQMRIYIGSLLGERIGGSVTEFHLRIPAF